jgi:hypothetical protein
VSQPVTGIVIDARNIITMDAMYVQGKPVNQVTCSGSLSLSLIHTADVMMVVGLLMQFDHHHQRDV